MVFVSLHLISGKWVKEGRHPQQVSLHHAAYLVDPRENKAGCSRFQEEGPVSFSSSVSESLCALGERSLSLIGTMSMLRRKLAL